MEDALPEVSPSAAASAAPAAPMAPAPADAPTSPAVTVAGDATDGDGVAPRDPTRWAARSTATPRSSAERPDAPPATRRLVRGMAKTIVDWQLVAPGDRVMVCLSGGKDSYTLLDLLVASQRRAPFDFELVAVHLDQRQPGYDGAPLRGWLERFGARFEIVEEDTYTTVLDLTTAGKSYCSVCSRMRRGVLYGVAERLGCNKIALGHHRDDALETLLMNLFFAGKLQAMPAKYTTDDGRFEVVRPLIECGEDDIRAHAAWAGYPILPCNLCGSQSGLQREKMADLLATLERDNPSLRAVMLAALKNVHPSHLLDADVARVWLARDRGDDPSGAETATRERTPRTGSPRDPEDPLATRTSTSGSLEAAPPGQTLVTLRRDPPR
jgi:tRNA 2-thiocytidine biosynthesis protein TtcA